MTDANKGTEKWNQTIRELLDALSKNSPKGMKGSISKIYKSLQNPKPSGNGFRVL